MAWYRSIVGIVALVLACGFANAQTPSRVYRVGVVIVGVPNAGLMAALGQGFTQRGYLVGTNLILEPKPVSGKLELLPQVVDELIADHVDLLITQGYPAALVAKQRAPGIPIVVYQSGDPVATGLVASLSHPGGNVTGVSEIAAELSGKRLQLLKEAIPTIRKVAVLWNADDLGMTLRYKAAQDESERSGVTIMALGVHAPNDFDAAFAEMTHNPPDAILMVSDVLTVLNRQRVIEFAAAHKIPAIYEYDFLTHDGGLMSYGPDLGALIDRLASLADRILKGAKPADLPLELPTRFQLAINLKTAKALGIDMPDSILARADDVIE